jgi:hypothetical protein
MANPLTTSNSDQANNNEVNNLIREVNGMKVTQIFKDDTGVRRVLLGKGPDGFYGLKVSKDTFDVYEADDDDLVFNSEQNVFKIVVSSTFNWQPVLSSNTASLTIAHNLGFTPIPLVYIASTTSTDYYPLPHSASTTVSGGFVQFQDYFTCSVDDTNLYITNICSLANPRANNLFKYYLLQETAK